MEKCIEDNFVRCCGASESVGVGENFTVTQETTTDSPETTTFEIPTTNPPESTEDIFLVYPEVPETTTETLTTEVPTTEISTTETPTTEIPTTQSPPMLILVPEVKTVEEQPQQRRKTRRRYKPQSKEDFIPTTPIPEVTSFTPKKDENRELRRNKVQQTYRKRTQTKTTTFQPTSTTFTKSKRPIFDASRRANFFSRTKPTTTPIEAVEEVKILPPQVDAVLQEKVDQEHRIMIEHVRSALSSRSLKNNFEIAQSNMPEIRVKELEAMEKMIQNLLMDLVKEISTEKPKTKINRGRKKYSGTTTTTTESTVNLESKPVTTKRRRMRITSTTTTTPSSEISTTKVPSKRRAYLTANRKMRVLNKSTTTTTTTTTETPLPETTTQEIITEIPQIPEITTENLQEIKNSPLIADFRPSPLWTLHSEADEIIYQITGNRQSRDTFQTPINLESGFVPMIHALNPLNIVGPVPSGFKLQFQDSLIFQLPAVESFTIFKI